MSVAAAARVLGVRRATLSDLVNGNASPSPEMALRVEKAFGLSMDLLLRMQAWHDATQMRARRRDRRSAVSAGMIGGSYAMRGRSRYGCSNHVMTGSCAYVTHDQVEAVTLAEPYRPAWPSRDWELRLAVSDCQVFAIPVSRSCSA